MGCAAGFKASIAFRSIVLVTADDIVISRNKPAEDQETEERRTKGFAKYDEYLKEATEKLYEWFKQEFLADRPVNDIDPAGGVQRFIKRISTMN